MPGIMRRWQSGWWNSPQPVSSRRAPQVSWLVAGMSRVPLASGSCQLLTSVFSPVDWQEALRLLAHGGGLLRMGPWSDHLLELRSRLYDEVRSYDASKQLQKL